MLFTYVSQYAIYIISITIGLAIGGRILSALWRNDKHTVIVVSLLVLAVVLHSQIGG